MANVLEKVEAGFIYILKNEHMPELLKIEKTTRHPIERAGELFTTGVPCAFEVVFAMWVPSVHEAERLIHLSLSNFRINRSREFFQLDEDVAVKVVLNLCVDQMDLITVHPDMELDEEDADKYAEICGLQRWDIRQVLEHISPVAWKAAAVRLEAIRQERQMLRDMEAAIGSECELPDFINDYEIKAKD